MEPVKGCGKRERKIRRRNLVVLSLYWLADDEGLVCEATNAAIARQAGLSVDWARWHMHDLENEGAVAALAAGAGNRRRSIVLMDHPEARDLVTRYVRAGRQPEFWTGVSWGVFSDGSSDPDELRTLEEVFGVPE